jgi:hypothetical protein
VHPLIEHIQKEWAVLKGAPISFVVLAVLCIITGIGIGSWHYGEKIDEKDGQIGRYRVALGIDSASKGALIELNNEELQSKTMNTASKLRDFCKTFEKRTAEITSEMTVGKIDKETFVERTLTVERQLSEEYHKDLRSDFLNLNNELLRRLDPKVSASVIRGPIFADAHTGTPIARGSFLPERMGIEIPYLCVDADQIEQLAKLLPPPNSGK